MLPPRRRSQDHRRRRVTSLVGCSISITRKQVRPEIRLPFAIVREVPVKILIWYGRLGRTRIRNRGLGERVVGVGHAAPDLDRLAEEGPPSHTMQAVSLLRVLGQ